MPKANMTQIRALAVLLAAGFSQKDASKLLGMTQAGISAQVRRDTGDINSLIEQYKGIMVTEVSQVFIKGES